jgi:hypothetical protein
VAVVLLETLVDLILEGELLLQFNRLSDTSTLPDKSETVTRMPVYLSIFAFAQYVSSNLEPLSALSLSSSIFQLVMAVNAVYARNTLQFMFLM